MQQKVNPSIYDLSFDEVKSLYIERKQIEAENNIQGRTKLRQQYPELFQEAVWQELKETFAKVIALHKRKKIIHLEDS